MKTIRIAETYKGKTIKTLNIRNESGKWLAWYGTHPFLEARVLAYPLTIEYHGAYDKTEAEAIADIKEVIDML